MTSFDSSATTSTITITCDHCGLPVPRGLINPADHEHFCCNGCRTVYQMIRTHGLDDYYRVRDTVNSTPQAAATSGEGYEAFDTPEFQAKHCQGIAGGYLSIDLRLEGIHCAACMWLVERLPRLVPGVASARLRLRDAMVRVTWNPQEAKLSTIATALDRLGYPAHPARNTSASDVHRINERTQLIRLGVAGACAGNTMLLAVALYAGEYAGIASEFEALFRLVSAGIGVVALAWPGSVFFRGAWAACRTRTASLDIPIALALAAGGVTGVVNVISGTGEIYFDSLSVLVFLLLVGRWFQARQQRWADEAVGLLNAFTPTTCRVMRGDLIVETSTDTLVPGDTVVVRSGELVPADGTVAEGKSTLDRSLLSGESQAVAVGPNDEVFAGTQNIGSTLHIGVTTTGQQTRVGRLMQLVSEGVREKPPIVQFTDRAAGWFVMAVVGLAAATFAWWASTSTLPQAVNHTIALLIVACPCALGLATPLTMAVAIGQAAKRHVLVKNAAVLDVLARSGRMLLDKTGTLTRGRPSITEWIGPSWLQPVVANAESHSTHPIAKALVDAYGNIEIGNAKRVPQNIVDQGDGGIQATVESQPLLIGSPRFLETKDVEVDDTTCGQFRQFESAGYTTIGVALAGKIEAVAAFGDQLHHDSAAAIAKLASQGWQVTIVSGDATGVVHTVANKISIPASSAFGEVSPERKLTMVTNAERDAEDTPTIMIGDGVNDAAALTAADVGIAVAGGTEASLAAADIYIASPGLMPIVQLIQLAKRTKRVVRQNLIIALAYNALAVSLAAAGYITPLVAAILMPISSATVLASAMSVTLGSED